MSWRGFSESPLSDFCNEMLLALPANSESVLLAQRLHTSYYACITKTEKTTERWNIRVDIISGLMVVEFLHILIRTYSMANFLAWSMPNSCCCCFHILYTNLEWSDDLAVIPYSSSFLLIYVYVYVFIIIIDGLPCQDFLNMLRISPTADSVHKMIVGVSI